MLCIYDWACYFIIILYVYMEEKTQAEKMSVTEACKVFDQIIKYEKSHKYRQFVEN